MMYSNVIRPHHFMHDPHSPSHPRFGLYGNDTGSLIHGFQHQQPQQQEEQEQERRISHSPSVGVHGSCQKQLRESYFSRHGLYKSLSDSHNARPVAQLAQPDGADHMLRRKTPNGTLSAGYDGTPVEWNARPSANKHLLIADTTPSTRPVFSQMPGSGRSASFSQRVGQIDGVKWGMGGERQNTLPSTWINHGQHVNGASNRHTWWPAQPASLDSMLHQMPQAQYHGDHQRIPTVLQPTWPPSIGPTASSAQMPFGPYWPSGAFEPYRPAAVRDTRFTSCFANISLKEPPDMRSPHSSMSWQANFNVSSAAGVYPLRQSQQDQFQGTYFCPEGPVGPPCNSNKNAQIVLPSEGRKIQWSEASTTRSRTGTFDPDASGQWIKSEHPAQYNPPASGSIKESSSKLHFRDKTLEWSHRVYVNLLTSVQQARRNSLKDISNERRHSQPQYFPRPPRYPSAHPSNAPAFHTKVGAQIFGPRLYRLQESRQDADIANNLHNSGVNTQGAYFETDARSLSIGTKSFENTRTRNQSIAIDPCSPQYSSYSSHQLLTPAAEAQAAFDMLHRLVEESAWRWTDGMLMGGCLAYGLGHHEIAKKWYISVLNVDCSNVEALSNLAATMTILGHPREAERYWRHAIKLRPSYFEAVEHLVGLLCQEQRNKEAVDVLQYMEKSLALVEEDLVPPPWEVFGQIDPGDGPSSANKRRSSAHLLEESPIASGYAIQASENGRLIALIHAKGNMLYTLGDNHGASKAFEDAVMVAAGRSSGGIMGLIKHILQAFAKAIVSRKGNPDARLAPCETILLLPSMALKTAEFVFPGGGMLPGLQAVPEGQSRRAAIAVASNSLLSLAKIYQDGMSSNNNGSQSAVRIAPGVQDILALYYLSLSLQPSPSTANNVGILLAGIQQSAWHSTSASQDGDAPIIPGVVPGSGIALALAYYNYGLNLDSRHAHLYTNLGSLLKDIGQLNAAIKMYEQAVNYDPNFDIALANLANAVKDQGRISDAIGFYKRAVTANPEFAEAVCGLANALNSVCSWNGRGGVSYNIRGFDRWHVNEQGILLDSSLPQSSTSGWLGRVVSIVEKQLRDGEYWGRGILRTKEGSGLFPNSGELTDEENGIKSAMLDWLGSSGQDWEGARVIRLVERATKRLTWQLYQEMHVKGKQPTLRMYGRPPIPSSLPVPSAPTVLPFHTFTCPLTAEQIRKISQRNGLRISCSTLKAPWLPTTVFEPPSPPMPHLNVGYVSSDFNNHPLAHLMQSVFGFHDISKVKAFCYATTAGDNSAHREQIQREAPVFYDTSSWSIDRLVKQILDDGIHILINLNGYTRGARNEVFAARPAPIQMSFMGFAGTLGAEWCDYILADTTAIPPSTLRPFRRNVDLLDLTKDDNFGSNSTDWVYGENIIYARDTFFCCDHRQSAPDSQEEQLSWSDERKRRLRMRKELFPGLPDDAVILGNFNQLYKIEPTTFRTWLRILQAVPNAVLWLLRFPDLGEQNLREIASNWATSSVSSRIVFTDVAPKHQHISRARVCDLFLDTPECNAHTTAADVLWSGTPLLTYPRYEFKMCSRMAASILKGALPKGEEGRKAADELVVKSEDQYEERAIALATGLTHVLRGRFENCRLLELRRLLYEGRWTSALFDTRRWVRDLEEAYDIAWKRYVDGEGGDIWL